MAASLPDLNELAAKARAAERAARDDPDRREAWVEALLEFTDALHEQHEFEHAAAASAEAMRVLGELVEEGQRELAVTLGLAMRRHADAMLELGEGERALEVYASALRLFTELARVDVQVASELAGTLLNHGEALRRCGRAEQALAELDRALAMFGGLGEDPAQVPGVALTQLARAKTLADLGRVEHALTASDESLVVFRELSSRLPHEYAVGHANALDARASLLRSLGRTEEAIEPAEQALEAVARLAHRDPVRFLLPLARLTNNLGRCYQQARRFDRAAAAFEQAVDGFRILARAQPHAYGTTLIQVMSNHSLALAQIGELERAHTVALEGLALAEREPGWGLLPLISGARQFLADLALDLGRPDEAIEHLQAGMRLLERAIAEGLPGAAEAATKLGASLRELKNQ